MEIKAVMQLQQLMEQREELISKGIVKGGLTEIGSSWVLRWTENGKTTNQTIPRHERSIYQAKTERYQKVQKIDRALAKIDKILVTAMEELGLAEEEDMAA